MVDKISPLDDKTTLEIVNFLCHTDYASLDDIPVDVLDMVCRAMETWLQALEDQEND